jgi:hypothetical protein
MFLLPGILSVVLFVVAWQTDNVVILETYKLVLSFTLLGILGVVVKAVVDSRLEAERDSRRRYEEQQKEQNRRYEEWEKKRSEIIHEFVHIFSAYYSLSKHYHSASSGKNQIYDRASPEYLAFLRTCLEKAADLEGRYGALKMLIVRHFGLPGDDLGFKEIAVLLQKKKLALTEKEQLRCTLDLLGQAYDDWRHALEQSRRIEVATSWSAYEEILGYLESKHWNNPTASTSPAAERSTAAGETARGAG